MVKGIKFAKYVLSCFILLLLAVIVYGFYTVPDELYAVHKEYVDVEDYYSIAYSENAQNGKKRVKDLESGRYQVQVKLFNAIPIKSSSLNVSERKYVVPSGEILGLRFFTQGVIVVKIDAVDTLSGKTYPAKQAGLAKGDVIISIDKEKVSNSNQVYRILSSGKTDGFEIEYIRGSQKLKTVLIPAFSASENKYKAGMWIRDSAAGIGTMTFYDVQNGTFACLGHGVCDVDTGEILPMSTGDALKAQLTGCNKGKQGKAGELCGVFTDEVIGMIYSNCEKGVYGVTNGKHSYGDAIPVATKNEVKAGRAHIISTVDADGPDEYEIEILKLIDEDENKNMIIQVTDKRLIEKTGGIVQGMSGSPIIQNGKLVGAVTHVLIGDPTKGYGIFTENMLEMTEKTARSVLQSAS